MTSLHALLQSYIQESIMPDESPTEADQHRPAKRRAFGHTSHAIGSTCSACRQKKTACNGLRPCERCQSNRIDCFDYNDAGSATSIQRTRQLLETKDAEIHRLSAKIRRMEHSVVVEDSPHRESSIDSAAEDEDEDTLTNRLKFVEDGIRHYGPNSTFAHLVENPVVDEDQLNTTAALLGHSPIQSLFPRSSNLGNTEHHHMLNLFEAYFAPWLNVVNMPAFRHALATSGTNHRSDFYSPLLHYVILGNAARFSDAIVPGAAAYFAAQAASLVLYECEKPMLSTVRGLALLGSLQTVLAKEDMASLYFGMSLTVAQGLGLHIDCSHLVASGKMTTEQKAARDDTFWSIFALDKLWATSLGRRAALFDYNVPAYKVDPELDSRIWQSPTSAMPMAYPAQISTVFAHTQSLMIIAADINTVMYSLKREKRQSQAQLSMESIRERLKKWPSTLPADIQIPVDSPKCPVPHVLTLHMYHLLLVILVHQPQSHGRSKREKGDPVAIEACDRAARQVVTYLDMYDQAYDLKYGPLTSTHIAYAAASVMLMASVAAQEESDKQAKVDLFDRIVILLKHMQHTWANQTADALLALRNEWLPKDETETLDDTSIYNLLESLQGAWPDFNSMFLPNPVAGIEETSGSWAAAPHMTPFSSSADFNAMLFGDTTWPTEDSL